MPNAYHVIENSISVMNKVEEQTESLDYQELAKKKACPSHKAKGMRMKL